MTTNMSYGDRAIRFVVAVAIAVAYAMGYLTATWAVWTFGIVAAILLATALVGFCPIYAVFGMSTGEPTMSRR